MSNKKARRDDGLFFYSARELLVHGGALQMQLRARIIVLRVLTIRLGRIVTRGLQAIEVRLVNVARHVLAVKA